MKKITFEFVNGHKCIKPCPYGQKSKTTLIMVGSNSCEKCKHHVGLVELPPSRGGCYVQCKFTGPEMCHYEQLPEFAGY